MKNKARADRPEVKRCCSLLAIDIIFPYSLTELDFAGA